MDWPIFFFFLTGPVCVDRPAKLICACVFATRIERFLYFLNQKFPFSSYLPTARFLSHQFGKDIVGFPTRRLICFGQAQFVWNGKAFLADPFESRTYVKKKSSAYFYQFILLIDMVFYVSLNSEGHC